MQINPNSQVRPVFRMVAHPPAVQKVGAETGPVEFSQVTALNEALQQAPNARAEQINRARKLVGEVDYPPRETMRSIAQLLAIGIDGEAD